ncbi:MAG TPA: hypothetical protein VLU25_01420 [Acidobacteriota bacterium]|nr:hypothetical protein [Acidobacteriota bacterium]
MKKTIAALTVLTLAAALFLQAAAPASLTPDATVMQVADGLAAGQPQVVWQALPASYQSDVTDLVHRFAEGMDRDIWNRSFAIMGKVSRVMTEKKDFIVENPMFSQHAQEVENVDENWDRLALVLSTLSTSELGDIDRLRTANPEAFLAGTGSVLMREFLAIAGSQSSSNPWQNDFTQSMSQVQATLISMREDSAVVQITGPEGKSEEIEFIKVEDKWVPLEMAQDWPQMIAEARENLSAIQPHELTENKDAVLLALDTVEGSLDEMLAAQTYTEFNNALQSLMGAGMFHFMNLQQQLEGAQDEESDNGN